MDHVRPRSRSRVELGAVRLGVMARWRPTWCQDCKTREGPISYRGLCVSCAVRRQSEAAIQLHAGEGPIVDAWVAGVMRRAAGTPVEPG